MNIAVFTDTYPPFINGVSTSCYNLYKMLKENGHNVLIIAPRTEDGPLLIEGDIIWIPGFKLKNLYGYRVTTLFSRKVSRILKKFKPDVIHVQTDATVGQFGRICAHRYHIPSVYTYHTSIEDYTYYATKGLMERIAKHLVRGYSKLIGDNSTEFITPSNKTKDYMRFTGSDIFINIVPTGINFSLFQKQQDINKVNDFKKAHHINENTKVFLILGRIGKEKSIDVSVKCFSNYVKKHPNLDLKMLIVGDGPTRPEIEELVKSLNMNDYIDFIGAVPASEVPFYYSLADIYTSASITETQGLTFMEAMSSGDMVLARFDDNLSGTIVDNETGFFFTDEDSFEFKVDRIFNLSEEEKKQIRDNANRTLGMYSIEVFYKNIMETYNRAIKKYW